MLPSLTLREVLSPFIEILLYDTKLKPLQNPMDEILYLDENMGSFYAIDPALQIEECQDTSDI
jgi:hypothetical protein